MAESGGRIQLVMGVAETELFEYSVRAGVLRVVPGEQSRRVERTECQRGHGARGLGRQPLPPTGGPDVESYLVNSSSWVVWFEAAASCVLGSGAVKHRPILEAVLSGTRDFGGQALANLLLIERQARDERSHLRIAP